MMNLSEVQIKDITEPLFVIRFNRDDRPLLTSIQNFGMKNPVSLLKRDSKYLIIDGSARIESARKIGKSNIPAFVYEDESLTRENSFLLTLELNTWSRELNLVEKAMALKEALDIYGGLKVPKAFWQAVGIKENIRSIHQYKDLLRLPKFIQKYAVNNTIPLSTILIFLKLPKDEIETIATQLFILPLNQNKLAEILGLLVDISKSEDKRPVEIMEEIFAEINKKQEFNAVQNEQMLRRLLQRRRNPRYEQQLKEFEKKVKNLPLDKHTKITPAPYFEEDYIEVSTRFYAVEDLEKFKSLLGHVGFVNLLSHDE